MYRNFRMKANKLHTSNQGWKRWFLRLWFFMVFKKPKNLERSDFLVFMVFLDIVVFCINYALKP